MDCLFEFRLRKPGSLVMDMGQSGWDVRWSDRANIEVTDSAARVTAAVFAWVESDAIRSNSSSEDKF